MYKVFFADDEAAMRAGIRDNIDWDNTDFSLVGEAPDGELALSLMSEMMPDILITDVKMPFMDGIRLSRLAKKAMPWIKIIILSGHDEFEYAKQAITIGVEAYLLKPVTSERLLETLGEIADRIEAEREDLKNIEKLADDAKQLQIERLLSELLYGNGEADYLLERAKELNISLLADYYLVLIIEIMVTSEKSYSFLQNACARAENVLCGWENIIFFAQGPERLICVLKGQNKEAVEDDAYTCAQAVKHGVERYKNYSVSVAIGTIVTSISQWSKSLADANMARRYLNLTGGGRIISLEDIRSGGMMPLKDVERLPTADKLRYASKSDIPKFLDDCFSSFENPSVASFMFMNYVYVDIFVAASKILEELGGDASEILSEYAGIDGLLASGSSPEEARRILGSILERTIDFRDSATGSKYRDVILRAQDYIRQNFDQQSISLHTVAGEVNISPNHFSTIFSQETGETFIGYITKLRLEKAKTLLKTTNMRTSEIGYAVGYNDTHYFSYVFKKNTGMSPKEFRK